MRLWVATGRGSELLRRKLSGAHFSRNGYCLKHCVNDDLRPVKLNVVPCVRYNDVDSSC
jgi:hypothetical protein